MDIRYAMDHLLSEESDLIRHFCSRTKEFQLMAFRMVPWNHEVCFFKEDEKPIAFLWTSIETTELNTQIIRVQALYVKSGIAAAKSRRITEIFEQRLTKLGETKEIKEIGFYTRRNPEAFLRRLNRTVPKARSWFLDSYVCVRRV